MTPTSADLEFKRQFWEWFDVQPTEFKKQYWYYKQDIVEAYFYNKIYKGGIIFVPHSNTF